MVDFWPVGYFFMEGMEAADNFGAEVYELNDGGDDPNYGECLGHDPFILLMRQREYTLLKFLERLLKVQSEVVVVETRRGAIPALRAGLTGCQNSGGLGLIRAVPTLQAVLSLDAPCFRAWQPNFSTSDHWSGLQGTSSVIIEGSEIPRSPSGRNSRSC